MTSGGSRPRRSLPRGVGTISLALSVACAAMSTAALAAESPSAAAGDVFYSPRATVDQAKSREGMRTYLSTDHPQHTLQSYVWAGSLVEDDGQLNTFACEVQRNPEAINAQRAKLRIAAGFQDQEVSADGRIIYEGLFSVSGTLCGKKVGGQAWTEVEPAANL
jgi:hypothetical protein